MSFIDYRKNLLQDIRYWQEVGEAKECGNSINEYIPPLTEEDKSSLPKDIQRFFNCGRWFFLFMNNVCIPYCRIVQLYYKHHIASVFKTILTNQKFNEVYDNKKFMADELYDFFSNISLNDVREICRIICEKKELQQDLLMSFRIQDLRGFASAYSNLALTSKLMTALSITRDFLKVCEIISILLESIIDIDSTSVNFVFQESLSEISHHNEEVLGFQLEFCQKFSELIKLFYALNEDKYNPIICERIASKVNSEWWMFFTKSLMCGLTGAMRRFWNVLTQKEKDVIVEILESREDIAVKISDKEIYSSKHIINIILRWSNRYVEKSISNNIHRSAISNDDNDTLSQIKESQSSVNLERLPFPTCQSGKVLPDLHNAFLEALFERYGMYFKDMSLESFIFLFGGICDAPKSYSPPYCWCGPVNVGQAMLSILYDPQPSILKREQLFYFQSKKKGEISYDWSRNKDKISKNIMRTEEKAITDIVNRILKGKTSKT